MPTRLYFSGSHAKVEIALARGKDIYDKRGGALEFVETHATAVNQRGEKVANMRGVTIVRN